MASSRAASVASRGDSPEPLTPRSKIKALLATVESSDEEGGTRSQSTRPPFLTGIDKQRTQSSPRSAQDDGSDDSDVITRPRGKLASRMQATEQMTKGIRSLEPTAASARERVRMMLERDEAKKNDEQASNGDGDDEDEDEDEDLSIAPRRMKRRPAVDQLSYAAEELSRPTSPGLFVSSPMRPSPTKSISEREDSDNDLPALDSNRFKVLVEQKRQERLAREAAEETRKAGRRVQQKKLASEMEQLASGDDDGGITDDEGGRLLTQEARPTRKASRKAIEEMNRETQRMARNMQLAHEAKTKKKISKSSLFERFNYKPAGYVESERQMNSSSRPATPQSDVEMKNADTPPSSPPAAKNNQTVATDSTIPAAQTTENVQDLTAHISEVTKPTSFTMTKGESGKQQDTSPDQKRTQKRRVRVRLPALPVNAAALDSDDDLQITTTTKDKLDILFDNIPSNRTSELHSIQALRALAQVRSPGKQSRRKADQSKMTPGELQAYLHLKARQQAKMERERRLEVLRGQGIVVQTAEEREKQEQEVEDLVAKARQEAQKIREEERDEAKRLRKTTGEVDPLAWDDSEDEEYRDSADEAAAELEVSGSEDEEVEDAEDEQDENESGNPLFDDKADFVDPELEQAEAQEKDEDDDEVDVQPVLRQRRARNTTTVLLSDDEGGVEATPKPIRTATQMTPAGASNVSPGAPNSVLRSAKKTFIPGLPVQGPAGLGLTQIFAGTMDSQTSDFPGNGPTQSMMPDFEHFPDSNFSATADELMEETIVDSQREEDFAATQGVQLNLSQSQMHGLGTLISHGMQTQMSEGMELSQDIGLQQHTPLRERFVEPPCSTVETMIVEKQDGEHDTPPQESPLVRKGRLRRRMDMSIAETAIAEASEENILSTQKDAFRAPKEATKEEPKKKVHPPAEDFNRKKSKAKEMVEEQAEESEDEYAGLGGVDGEDSDNESNGSVEEMIDDTAGNDSDERKLAAFYADRERAQDEQQVEKLFKDITKGMLRRKRGADFDLSDSDSDGEARKRMKRRQFAKMQKALFADERVKRIAENPGNQAFLRTIEDHGSDDEMDFLDRPEDSPSQAHAETQSQDDGENQQRPSTTIPDSQPHSTKPLDVASENRPPAHLRRTKKGKKPSNIGQVRETLSNLLDEPQASVVPATEDGSDSEAEEEEEEEEDLDQSSSSSRSNKENQAPPHMPTSTAATTTIINRLGLKRNSSSASSTRMAFSTASASASFKVPALLRRATANSTLSTSSSSAVSTAGGFGEEAKIKKGAGKKSGINGFARENESRVLMKESERRRQERKVRGAEKRIGMVGGLLGRGAFE
ncbi:hypothetical protein C2857_002856 [Epichloe festucae Fl1]|uniref:DNA replication checkpoint mediator MRC1 domain-containing protein n=1 Tax=Epichloe festucae (strain Fl1) TaxID=877507 RepID=A0A7S9PWT5_EPIFF|nr:hypothetical protein C2857_002856 [Epichloe festucae Fl1]